jgi:hypothetical protein
MRAFSEQSSTKRATTEQLNTDSPYYRLLTKPSTIKVDFTEHPDWESEARKNKLIRFMANPHARWGPLGKAVTKKKRSNDENDSVQNKKQVRFFISKILFISVFFFSFRQNQMKIYHLKKIYDNFFLFL